MFYFVSAFVAYSTFCVVSNLFSTFDFQKKKKSKEKPGLPIDIETPLPAVTHDQTSREYLRRSSVEKIAEEKMLSDGSPSEIDIAGHMGGLSEQPTQDSSVSGVVAATSEAVAKEDTSSCAKFNIQLDNINISSDTVTVSPMESHLLSSSTEGASTVMKDNTLCELSDTNQTENKFCQSNHSALKSTSKDNLPNEPSSIDQLEPTTLIEDVRPSAPLFDEPCVELLSEPNLEQPVASRPKVQCMPLEQAIRLFGGEEMSEVHAMSEREEAIVEAGPVSGPEHPLVDLLSTFR